MIFFRQHGLTEIRAWMGNYIHCFVWGVAIHPYPDFNGGLTKQPMKLAIDE